MLCLLHFDDVVGLPGLVEELDAGAVEAQRHDEVPTVDGPDEFRVPGFDGPNHRSIEPSLLVATLSKPLIDGGSCGVSGIVPSAML